MRAKENPARRRAGWALHRLDQARLVVLDVAAHACSPAASSQRKPRGSVAAHRALNASLAFGGLQLGQPVGAVMMVISIVRLQRQPSAPQASTQFLGGESHVGFIEHIRTVTRDFPGLEYSPNVAAPI